MYLMYVDESGDIGTTNSPTQYFILSALIVHELRWNSTMESLIEFRRFLREEKNLKLRDEIHATNFVNRPGELRRIKRNDRIDILKKCIDWIRDQQDINVISVRAVKAGKTKEQIFGWSWERMIQRFENTIRARNFNGPANPDERGIILADRTDDKQLRLLIRRMRRYNPIANIGALYTGGYRNLTLDYVIEDPVMRESRHSFLHQMVDVVAYCARQLYEPNKYMKRKGGHNFYKRLDSVLIKQAAPSHPLGIVEL